MLALIFKSGAIKMTTGIWLLWPRPPLAIAFIKEHECALKESPWHTDG